MIFFKASVSSVTVIDKKVQFKIKDIKQSNGNVEVILSRKDVEIEVKKWMFENLKEGMKLC